MQLSFNVNELSEERKNELRSFIIKELNCIPDNLPFNERVKLPKDLLESLIFEKEFRYNFSGYGKSKDVKYPVWTGPFLRKLDLSMISFNDVCWNISTKDTPDCIKMPELDSSIAHTKQFNMIDLSGTNVVIDFAKATRTSNGDATFINCFQCNFSGVDLSKSNCEKINGDIQYCDFSNTGAKFDFKGVIINSNFQGCDLSKCFIPVESLMKDHGSFEFSPSLTYVNKNRVYISIDNNFINTCLNINLSNYISNTQEEVEVLTSYILSGRINGCYVYDGMVKIMNDKHKTLKDIRDEYENMIKSALIAEIQKNISENPHFNKKRKLEP